MTTNLRLPSRTEIVKVLKGAFNIEGLRDLCFQLDVEYDDLRGEARVSKVRELVIHCEQNGRTADLVGKIKELRPSISFGHEWFFESAPSASAISIEDLVHAIDRFGQQNIDRICTYLKNQRV